MLRLPVKEQSLIRPAEVNPAYPELKSDIQVDSVVVGGGITGINTAYLLKKSGQKVAVLEQDTIGSGTTGHTTGKVTSQHSLNYAEMVQRIGKDQAKIYAEANQTAINSIEDVIKAHKIECGWQRADNYVFTADEGKVKQFKEEAKVSAELGLPASFVTDSPLPFQIKGAVKFTNQAHFSAQKYINALAEFINQNGSFVYEQTRANWFHDGSVTVTTAKGTVRADNIVVATNVPTFPLLARFVYCALEYPHTSYIVSGRPKVKLSGMFISPDKDHYSILPVGEGSGQILLVGGENHITGLGIAKNRQRKLASYAERHFGVSQIDYRWHARDYMAYDNVPLIGRLYPWSKHLYTATAFKKWGLAHSMVAAQILADAILGRKNAWAETYKSTRLRPVASIPGLIARNILS